MNIHTTRAYLEPRTSSDTVLQRPVGSNLKFGVSLNISVFNTKSLDIPHVKYFCHYLHPFKVGVAWATILTMGLLRTITHEYNLHYVVVISIEPVQTGSRINSDI